MLNYAYLIQVNANENNNKYYEITENDDNSLDVRYGRVGRTEIKHHYEPWQKNFYGLKDEKERKGYEDRTALHSEVKADTSPSEELSYKPVEDKEVQKLLELLIKSSREFMQRNYTVSAMEVTDKMIKEARNDIEELNRIAMNEKGQVALYRFNNKLQELFTDIPRNMKKVKNNLAETEQDFKKIIDRETEMLDNLSGIVKGKDTVIKQSEAKDITVLEANGLSVRPVTYKEEDSLIDHLGVDYDGRNIENRFVKAYAVENNETRKRFNDYKNAHGMTNKDVRLFYHGSKVENWYSIMKQGLSLNPKATTTGKMFGQGLYFAPELRKSLNYMDVSGSHWNSGSRQSGYCAVYSVALGKCYEPNSIVGSNFREKNLPKGTNSLFASKHNPHLGLRNDEYIVYNQDACTIKYLMEITKQAVRSKDYTIDRKTVRDKIKFRPLEKSEGGVRAAVDLDCLGDAVRKELESKLPVSLDSCKELAFNYSEAKNRINISYIDSSGKERDIGSGSFTPDDMAFLSREMKKAFAESENEWKTVIKDVIENNIPIEKEVKEPELFGIKEGIICQQCNCRGAYGAGLSGAISDQYPEVLTAFREFNKSYPSPDDQLGRHQIVPLKDEDDLYGHGLLAVANLYTQRDYGNGYRTGIKYTDTDKLVENIKSIAEFYNKIPVYIPHSVDKNGRPNGIGCGLAGEKWENLYPLLEDLNLPNLYLLDTHTGQREKVNPEIPFNEKNPKTQLNITKE